MSSSSVAEIQTLAARLERAKTTEEKIDALISYHKTQIHRDLPSGPNSDISLQPGGNLDPLRDIDDKQYWKPLSELLDKHGLTHSYFKLVFEDALLTSAKPLERLPCANVEPTKNWSCLEEGKLSCRGCKLVSYCGKVDIDH